MIGEVAALLATKSSLSLKKHRSCPHSTKTKQHTFIYYLSHFWKLKESNFFTLWFYLKSKYNKSLFILYLNNCVKVVVLFNILLIVNCGTCVECFPRADSCFLASTLQLVFAVQHTLYFYWRQLVQLLKLLQLAETLSSSAGCKAWCPLWLFQVSFHTFCPLHIT